MPDITSRQHPLVRTFRSAAQHDPDVALLDGWHLLHDADAAGLVLHTVAHCGVPESPRDRLLLDRLGQRGRVCSVTPAVMDALSPVRTPSGVVAIAERREWAMPALLAPAPALVLVAADIQDPGNAGAIIRAAEAGGATGVALIGDSADPWGWKALRASMGSTFRLPVLRTRAWAPLRDRLREAGLVLIATLPRSGTSLSRVDLSRDVGILLGGEGAGLAAELVRDTDEQLTIPMQAPVESLNAATAAAVIVYEARRQREA